jgi:hypothetical protein
MLPKREAQKDFYIAFHLLGEVYTSQVPEEKVK